MQYLRTLSLLLWVAAVGLVGMLASPTRGDALADPTVVIPATRQPRVEPSATPTPLFRPFATPVSLDPTADLTLTLAAPDMVHRGGALQLRYTVVNLGPAPVRGATFVVVLPWSYYLDTVRPGMGWACNVQNYAAVTLDRPVTVICQRANWLLPKVPEDIRVDLTVTTSALDRAYLGVQAAVVSQAVDYTPAYVQYVPGIE